MYNFIKSPLEGARLQNEGNHDAAKIEFRKLLDDDPDNLELLNQLVVSCIKTNEFDAAIDACRKSLAQDPRQVDIHFYLGIAYYNWGDIGNCIKSLKQALNIDPSRSEIKDLLKLLKARPYLGIADALQGVHAPERQVFMSAVVDLLKDKRNHLKILEIGTYAGSSALTWFNAVENLFPGNSSLLCVDAWEKSSASQYGEHAEKALKSNRVYEAFLHNMELAPESIKIDHIRALSEDALPNLEDASFDIIYIDGCHYYREALSDILESKRLISNGGVICGDDLELNYDEIDTGFAAANKKTNYVKDPKTGIRYHPGVTLAVNECFGAVSQFRGFWAMQKSGKKFEEVSLKSATGILPKHFPEYLIEEIKNYFDTSNLLGNLAS